MYIYFVIILAENEKQVFAKMQKCKFANVLKDTSARIKKDSELARLSTNRKNNMK